jgi:PTS system nitrogen regulatory IIA component
METMTLEEVASYLQRDVREVTKLANRGHLPGQKVAGQWRFQKVEINHWIESQMHAYTEQELSALERGHGYQTEDDELLISTLMSEANMAVPFNARTRDSVLRGLVKLAEQSWQVYDPEAILTAIQRREEMASTAVPSGVAVPHPHRPLPNALGESVLAYGRTLSGIPFGGERGMLTDIYFLVCCRDDQTHLRVLARLSRLLLRPEFLDELRARETAAETHQLLESAERDLLGMEE